MDHKTSGAVGAVILAAGMSKRMGQAKLVLPYKGSTVIGAVLSVLNSAGVSPLIAVSGGAREAVEAEIERLSFQVIIAHNPDPARTEMMDSLRIGMAHLPANLAAFMIVLGDQPQIQPKTVSQLIQEFHETGQSLIIPSYRMRRGHPWLIGRNLWDELVALEADQTMRDFINQNRSRIHYLEVDTDSVLEDLDTPEDYARAIGNGVKE